MGLESERLISEFRQGKTRTCFSSHLLLSTLLLNCLSLFSREDGFKVSYCLLFIGFGNMARFYVT